MKTNKTDSVRADFTGLIEKHKGIIYKIANAYSRSVEDQEDLVQEIILQLWSSYGNYDPKYRFSTWIYRIAFNISITHYRKEVVRKKHRVPMSERFIDSIPSEDDSKTEDIPQLRKFIQELDEMNRALMILYLDGNSHQEISSVMNISVSNVGTKISRIKEKLREKFKN